MFICLLSVFDVQGSEDEFPLSALMPVLSTCSDRVVEVVQAHLTCFVAKECEGYGVMPTEATNRSVS